MLILSYNLLWKNGRFLSDPSRFIDGTAKCLSEEVVSYNERILTTKKVFAWIHKYCSYITSMTLQNVYSLFAQATFFFSISHSIRGIFYCICHTQKTSIMECISFDIFSIRFSHVLIFDEKFSRIRHLIIATWWLFGFWLAT